MNRQEIFDKVVTHLLTQNRKALGEFGGCRYRTKDGLSCAVGCLLDDETAAKCDHPEAHHPFKVFPSTAAYAVQEFLPPDLQAELPLLNTLQEVHDTGDVQTWPDRLRRVAEQYELQYNGSR